MRCLVSQPNSRAIPIGDFIVVGPSVSIYTDISLRISELPEGIQSKKYILIFSAKLRNPEKLT